MISSLQGAYSIHVTYYRSILTIAKIYIGPMAG
jgi:hypothetical protein